jgi:hypothetical protein
MSKEEYEKRLNYIFIHSRNGYEFITELQALKEAMKDMEIENNRLDLKECLNERAN